MFKKSSFQDKFDYHLIYPTTHDAILSILRKSENSYVRFISKTEQSANLFNETILTLNSAQETEQPPIDSTIDVNAVYARRKLSNVFDEITIKTKPEND